MGFQLNGKKLVAPRQRIQFFGVVIDSALSRIEIPQDQLDPLLRLLVLFAARKKVTKRELQVLVGYMSFAAKGIYGARTFTRIFIDAMVKLDKPHHKLRISKILHNEIGGELSRQS